MATARRRSTCSLLSASLGEALGVNEETEFEVQSNLSHLSTEVLKEIQNQQRAQRSSRKLSGGAKLESGPNGKKIAGDAESFDAYQGEGSVLQRGLDGMIELLKSEVHGSVSRQESLEAQYQVIAASTGTASAPTLQTALEWVKKQVGQEQRAGELFDERA